MTRHALNFKNNQQQCVGVELELQLVNLHSKDLILEAEDFLRRLSTSTIKDAIKPEISQSMIEINSTVHTSYQSLYDELTEIKDILLNTAKMMHIGICGGGTHPFQKWKAQKIFENERFVSLSEQYGYLAKQFTIFGQHVHISCMSGDDALYLSHALAYYIPHFIALSASSPFNQGVDTCFDCSRLSVISVFPLSGIPPYFEDWQAFIEYFDKLYQLNLVKSMKDFYWDIRPKPEFGTVEVRICDVPLTITKACDLAYYIYNLVSYLLDTRPPISSDTYLSYLINRFRAARFGFAAEIIDVSNQTTKLLKDDILATCDKLHPYAEQSQSTDALGNLRYSAFQSENDAHWLRRQFNKYHTLEDVVACQIARWRT